MIEAIQESFRIAMKAAGLVFSGPVVSDGKLHRFKAVGDRERNSWYVLHSNTPAAGAFGCWKRGLNETWCNDRNGQLSEIELTQVRRRWQEAARERERDAGAARERARKVAEWIISRSSPAKAHAYLASKGVKPIGKVLEYHGALVLELRDASSALHSLQFISPDGSKRFLRRSQVSGCFFTLFERPDLPLIICEGYATGASIHEATGFPVVAAISSGNLLAVAQSLRRKWPQREIIIASDNDAYTQGNPGVAKATEAAKSISAKLGVPQFTKVSSRPTDFNDLATLEGLEIVRNQIEAATQQSESDDEILQRLAALPPSEYERKRKSEAQHLGYRVSILDELVNAKRMKPNHTPAALQGHAMAFDDPEPWPKPVNGAHVLNELEETFTRYVVLPDGAAAALALWSVHTYVFDAFDCSPRLNVSSPEKGCGKTTLRDVLAELVARPLATENLTVPVLFRVIELYRPTVLADECDAWIRDNDELRGMLNAGHRRSGQALRCEGEKNEVRAFNVFAPAVLCGIGELPSTLDDRSIKVRLERAKLGELRERFDSRRTQREQELRRRITRFCADHRAELTECDPLLPPGVFNRLADNWRPLFAIAEIAGGGWPERAAASFARLVFKEDGVRQGIGIMLLVDIQQIFREAGAHRLFSRELIAKLCSMTDRPWPEAHRGKPVTEIWLAKRLHPFRILPKTIRIESERAKGYELASFEEAFSRYISDQDDSIRDSATTQGTSVSNGNSSRDNTFGCHGSKPVELLQEVGLSPCHGSYPPENTEVFVVGEI
jgi:putative DNA primase/helicase